MFWPNLCGISRKLGHVVEHGPFSVVHFRLRVVGLQGAYELLIQRGPTQKLCVTFSSVKAPIEAGNQRGNHLMLPARQRQFGREQARHGYKDRLHDFG